MIEQKENSVTIQFIKTNVAPIVWKHDIRGNKIPIHFRWNQVVNEVAFTRYKQAVDLLQKDLEVGRKVIAIADRKDLLERLLNKFQASSFQIAYLHGNLNGTDRATILDKIKVGNVDLLLSTKLLECMVEMQGCNIVKDPLSTWFDTVHILTPTVASFERRCLLPDPMRIRKIVKHLEPIKKDTLVRYYVDNHPWLESCAFKNKNIARKNGWKVKDV